MGKENNKGKDKKLKRQADLLAEKARKMVISEALAVQEPLAGFGAFTKFQRNGLDAEISCVPAPQLSAEEHEWCFSLLKSNMEAIHNAGGFTWNDSTQRAMLKEEDASILIARDKERPLGFAHYKYMIEGDVEILHVDEIHLEEAGRSKGLGKLMMQLLELMAAKAKMKFVMATVVKTGPAADGRALDFFLTKLKWSVDEGSPSRCDVETDPLYEIVSKCVDKELIKARAAEAKPLAAK